MNLEKVKNLLKNKKVVAITGLVTIAVIGLAVSGYMMVNNKNISNDKKITSTKEVENEDKKEKVKKDDSKKEESAETRTSTEAKEEVNNTSSNNEASNSSSDVTINSSSESSTSNSTSSSNSTTSSEETSNSSSSSNNVGTTETKKETPSHTHNWVAVTSTVHHEAEGHYEDVVVTPESTKEVPVYETVARDVCNGCDLDITDDIDAHIKPQMLAGNMACSSWRTEWKEVQTGTKTETIPAVIEKKWVVDKEAWDETVTSGHKCSSCGETK